MKNIDFVKQEQVIIGTLLGDGYMAYQEAITQNHKLQFTHSLKQKEYAFWKARQIGLPFSTYYRHQFDKRTGKTYSSIIISFKADKIFNYYYDMFYTEKKKIASVIILHRLQQLGIITWYCDDGNLYLNQDTKILTLSTDSFSYQERELAINLFKHKYDLNFKKCSKGAIRLVSLKEIRKFMTIFGQFIPNCMTYKKTDLDFRTYRNRYYGN